MTIYTTSKRGAAFINVCHLLLLLAATTSAQTLLWSDEFNTDGSPNPNVWAFDTGNGGWGNGELQTYTTDRSNVEVANGRLKITAQKDDTSSPPTFTSARLKTQNNVQFKYGRLVARIKVPDVDAGLWPAFWTMGYNVDQVGWPAAGEVDIMEIGQGLAIEQGLANKRVVSAAHWEYNGDYATYAKWYDSDQDLSEGFHIYRLEWTPDSMATYVDDAMIWQMNIGPQDCEDCEELHHPHFILFNLAVGGGFTSGGSSSSGSSSSSGCGGSSSAGGSSSSGGCPTRGPEDITAPFPGEMLVDWVRLYDNGHTETNIPTPRPTPQPTSRQSNGNPQTAPPTKKPSRQPTAAPVSNTPAPVARSTRAPQPTVVTLLPVPGSSSFEDDDDDDDDVVSSWEEDDDCFYGSGSRSGGKAGKGGKGGKGGSSRSRARSGGGSKAGGKGGKGSRRLMSGKGSSKGKGGSRSRSSSSRCTSRSAVHSSHLATQTLPASSALSSKFSIQASLCLMVVAVAGMMC